MVVELRIAGGFGDIAAFVDDGGGAVALAEFDAVGVELVVLQLDCCVELAAAITCVLVVGEQFVQRLPSVSSGLSVLEAERLRDRQHVTNALHSAVDDLIADRLALLCVGVE